MKLSVWDCFILQILTYQTETGKQTIFAALHFSDRKRKVFLGGVGGWDAGVSALFVLETAEVTVWLDPSASLFVSMSFRPESAEDFQPVVSSPVLDATPPNTHTNTPWGMKRFSLPQFKITIPPLLLTVLTVFFNLVCKSICLKRTNPQEKATKRVYGRIKESRTKVVEMRLRQNGVLVSSVVLSPIRKR